MEQTQKQFDPRTLTEQIRRWGLELGFQRLGISSIDLSEDEQRLQRWLDAGYHGEMDYMQRHGHKRSRPAELVPGTLSVITARMNYLPSGAAEPWSVLRDGERGYLSRYALGRDYHKLLRKRLQRLATKIGEAVGPFGYRAFVDSAPVLEKPLAAAAGLGWVGKHSNLLSREDGSWFFLGELFTDLPLPADSPMDSHCGTCQACIDLCPTAAIIEPYVVDARRCISYLTIEHRGSIPEPLRPLMGNRIYGCDDCQLVCPWNRFASVNNEPDFAPRNDFDNPKLIELFGWDEATFLRNTEGSAIRRIGHESWLRNLAVAMGNAPRSEALILALQQRLTHPSEIVREHTAWALARQQQ